MSRVSAAILLVCWIVSASTAQESPLRSDCGGWKPPVELLARAMALKGLDAEGLAAAAKALEDEGGAALRIRVCRAGLRLADEKAAFACATRLDWNELDLWETERVIALCLAGNAYVKPGTPVDFEKLRSMIGGKELPRIFASFPPGPWNKKATYYLANLHRQCTAEHLPVLAKMLTRSEAEVRENAADNIRVTADRTDRHRDLVLRAGLSMEGVPLATGPERALGPDAWTPALRTIALGCWPGQGPGLLDPVERRAVLALTPLPEDEARIRRLVGRALREGAGPAPLAEYQFPLLRALRHFRSPETRDLLRLVAATDRLDAGHDWSAQLVALAALAAGGDAKARTLLARRAPDDPEAIALWLEAEPRAAAAWYERQLLGGTDADTEHALSRWNALCEARHALLLDWPDDLFAGLPARAAASPRGGLALAGIATTIPGCATRGLARAALARLQPREIVAMMDRDGDYRELVWRFAFLDAAGGEATRAWLRARAGDSEPRVREFALAVLLVVGDPGSAALLVDWVRKRKWGEDLPLLVADQVLGVEVLLGRIRRAETRAFLVPRARKEAARAEAPPEWPDRAIIGLAVADGLPPMTACRVAGGLDERYEKPSPDVMRRWKLIAAGRTFEALALALESMDEIPIDLWRVDRPEVRAFLRRMQRERERGLYYQATAVLACLGDPAARRETLAALRAGRYRWVDELCEESAVYVTLGHDLVGMVPFWIDQLESNCCRHCIAYNVLEELFADRYGLFLEGIGEGWETRASIVGRWWKRHRGAVFIHSRLVDRFIPVLPD